MMDDMTHIYDVISESQLQTGISSTGTRQLGQTLAVATLGSCVLTLFRFPVPSRSNVVPTLLNASSILKLWVINYDSSIIVRNGMSDPEKESGFDLLMTLNTANCIKLIRLSKPVWFSNQWQVRLLELKWGASSQWSFRPNSEWGRT